MSDSEKQYLVTWEMDVYAKSPLEAAEKALAIHRDPNSKATFFGVREYDADPGSEVSIDLLADEEDEQS